MLLDFLKFFRDETRIELFSIKSNKFERFENTSEIPENYLIKDIMICEQVGDYIRVVLK